MMDDGQPAFPVPDDDSHYYGMSLRDYFAGQALNGISATPDFGFETNSAAAKWCYEMSDAMLKARREP